MPKEQPAQTFLSDLGDTIIVSCRPLAIETAELRLDLEPFFNLITLFQHATRSRLSTPVRGRVIDVTRLQPSRFWISFKQEDQTKAEISISDVEFATITIWRVNEILDTLQVYVSSPAVGIYLQTGGAGLFAALKNPESPTATTVASLFQEPINRLIQLSKSNAV